MSKFDPDQVQRGDLPTELNRLNKRVDDSERAKNLRASSFSSGGIRVREGGRVTIEGDGQFVTTHSSGNPSTWVGHIPANPEQPWSGDARGFWTGDSNHHPIFAAGQTAQGNVVHIGGLSKALNNFTLDSSIIRLSVRETIPQSFIIIDSGLTAPTYFSGVNIQVPNIPSSGLSANLVRGADNRIYVSTSSIKYKQDVEDYRVDVEKVLKMDPKTWRDKTECSEHPETENRYVGFLAEDLHELGMSEFVVYKDGEPDSIAYDRISAALVELAKAQHNRINELEERLNRMEERMSKLEGEDS